MKKCKKCQGKYWQNIPEIELQVATAPDRKM
jgi:hypothetical protein